MTPLEQAENAWRGAAKATGLALILHDKALREAKRLGKEVTKANWAEKQAYLRFREAEQAAYERYLKMLEEVE